MPVSIVAFANTYGDVEYKGSGLVMLEKMKEE